ncbi:MAG: type II secretion system protein GspL [Gammaproteobacteria bacterium]
MRNTLLLRADSVPADRWNWLRLGPEGAPVGNIRVGSLQSAANEAAGLRAVVLVPGADCLLTRVRIPGRNRQKLLRAIPYVLEDQLSDEVEQLHFAVGEQTPDEEWPVVVISRNYMATLLEAVAEAGLEVQQVIPETLAIPFNEGEFSVLVSRDIALVRTGTTSGFAVDSDNLGVLLAAQPLEEDQPAPLVHMYVNQDSQVPDTSDYGGQVNVETFAANPLGIFVQGLATRPINLLQGAFSRRGEWSRVLKPWRATAALLLAGVLVSLFVTGFDYFRLSKESEHLQARIEETFRKAMPGTQRVVNPRVQLQQELDRLQGGALGGGFLLLLAKTGAVLKDVSGVEIAGVTFRAGRLDLDIMVSNLQLLDTIKQSLANAGGLEVEIQSATTGNDQRVQSRLRIQRADT